MELLIVFLLIPRISVVLGQLLHKVQEGYVVFLQLFQHHALVNLSSGLKLLIMDESPHLSLLVELQHHLDRVDLGEGVRKLC